MVLALTCRAPAFSTRVRRESVPGGLIAASLPQTPSTRTRRSAARLPEVSLGTCHWPWSGGSPDACDPFFRGVRPAAQPREPKVLTADPGFCPHRLEGRRRAFASLARLQGVARGAKPMRKTAEGRCLPVQGNTTATIASAHPLPCYEAFEIRVNDVAFDQEPFEEQDELQYCHVLFVVGVKIVDDSPE